MSEDRLTIRIGVDSAAFEDCLLRLRAILADPPEGFAEAAEVFFRALETGEQVVAIKGDLVAAGGAGEVVMRLEPSDALLDLLAAGARDGD